MHIIGIIIAVASAIFWISRAMGSARDIGRSAGRQAQGIANLPRKRRFQKQSNKRGLDLIDEPIDAALVLMVSISRLSDYARRNGGLLSDDQAMIITNHLVSRMELEPSEAQERITQIRWTVSNVVLPETVLMPMTNLLNKAINRSEAKELGLMLEKIARAHGQPNDAQNDFLRKYRERAGLGV